jgi:hypothetical protein
MDWKWIGVLAASLSVVGCATQDIPQAHRGRIYGRTGLWALYQGDVGFNGPVLDPGTRFLGAYDELRMLDCSMRTVTETFDTMTRDGVHFGFTLSVRFNADCSDESVVLMLGKLTPDKGDTISGKQIYGTFILPAIKEAAREFISPYRANELNDKQAEVVTGVRRRFLEIMETRENHIVAIHEVNVGELKFPPEMDNANLERAVQSVLKDKAIAERERIGAEVDTMASRRRLAEEEAEVVVARIERIGSAVRRFPEFLQYMMANQFGDMRGTLVMTPPGFFNLNTLPATSAAPPLHPAAPRAPTPEAPGAPAEEVSGGRRLPSSRRDRGEFHEDDELRLPVAHGDLVVLRVPSLVEPRGEAGLLARRQAALHQTARQPPHLDRSVGWMGRQMTQLIGGVRRPRPHRVDIRGLEREAHADLGPHVASLGHPRHHPEEPDVRRMVVVARRLDGGLRHRPRRGRLRRRHHRGRPRGWPRGGRRRGREGRHRGRGRGQGRTRGGRLWRWRPRGHRGRRSIRRRQPSVRVC